ncbi:MAG: molybdopterin-dependent oxidoreductase, partial [Candidatus Eisenbacteria bacterium]|nr:molybdopterin-dependent oxidoreductase [Candidatus Eisenbacteria bacterium]
MSRGSAMESIELKINGQAVTARPGQTILEVVREQGLDDIPTLCHSPELEPYGSCFLCTVEVKGRRNLVPSCATRVVPEMEVTTRNQRILASRRTALELLISNHYADCVSPCMLGCPAGVDAQGYIALAAMGNHRQAVDLIRETNPLPAICGRVCVRKCEVVCRRTDVDAPVGINAIKRFVTDAPGIYDAEPRREPDRGQSVGIVGAGPAGLTAAWFLGRRGYRPVIYEAMPRSGGMLRYGIPTYRLPDDVLDREVDYICRAGAEIRYNVRVGRDVSLAELRTQHDAIFLASGAWAGKSMRAEGEDTTEGVLQGVDFLREKADDPSPVEGTIVVIGGGNTAMDVARTAWRCGAEKVIILYRRTKAEMPADEMEIEDCIAEGIEIIELVAPIGVVAEEGQLRALRCVRMKLTEPDESGRRRPVPLEGSEFDFPCDLAVRAIGQGPIVEGLDAVDGDQIGVSRWQTFEVDDQTMATNLPGVFAGGDAAGDGPTVVIDAIRDGQRAARAIDAYMRDEPLPRKPFIVTKEFWGKPGQAELGQVPESPRHEVHTRPVEERAGNFQEVATGFEPEDAAHEAARCLACGCLRYDDCALRLYAEEYGVDLERFAGYVRRHQVDDRHPYVVYDPNKCILCARCIRTCARVLPISALGLVNRGFRTEMRPAMNDPLVETSCISCGNCIDSCPTGALTVKYAFPGRAALPAEEVASHCAVCSLGCAIRVKRLGGDRYYITASGEPGQYLCRYGRFGYELFAQSRRLRAPLRRSGSDSCEISFGEADAAIVEGLRRVVSEHGPESVGVFASPELTNEELYLAARFAREALGTNNIASLAALETGREAGEVDEILGFTASTAGGEALADADLIVCSNTATESDALILAVEILRAARGGTPLVVVNSILDAADRHLARVAMDPMRGRATAIWSGVLRALLEDGALARERVAGMPGGTELLDSLDPDLERMAETCGVRSEQLRETAALVAGARRIVFVHSPDRPEDFAPGDAQLLADLVVLLREAGKSVELLLPRLNANHAGLEPCGVTPAFLPGRRAAGERPGARRQAELREMLRAGRLRGALIIGEDPLEHRRTGAYFQNIEFLAAIDWTETETTRFADVTLPGTTYLETEGTRCDFAGRIVEFARAVQPPAGIPGWRVLARLCEQAGVPIGAAEAG